MEPLESDAEFVENSSLEELENKIKSLRDEIHANLLSNNYSNVDLLRRIKFFRLCYFTKKYGLTPQEAYDYLIIITKEKQNRIINIIKEKTKGS